MQGFPQRDVVGYLMPWNGTEVAELHSDFFFFFLMQICSNSCPRLSHNQELLVHLFMKYSKMQVRTSQP